RCRDPCSQRADQEPAGEEEVGGGLEGEVGEPGAGGEVDGPGRAEGEGCTTEPTHRADRRRLREDQAGDRPGGGADRAEDADLAGPAADGGAEGERDVEDGEGADQEGEEGEGSGD